MKTHVLLLAITALLGACAPDAPTDVADALTPSFSRGGGGNPGGGGGETLPTQANLVWEAYAGSDGTLIRGDGLNKDGSTGGTLNEYEGGYCGVWTHLWNGKREDGRLDFDPDTYFDGTCGPRALVIDFGSENERFTGVLSSGPQLIVPGIWAVGVGGSAASGVVFGMQHKGPDCRLIFDAAYGVSAAIVTRLDDGSGPRRWRVTSEAPHLAACVEELSNGRLRDTGVRYTLPFSVLVTARP